MKFKKTLTSIISATLFGLGCNNSETDTASQITDSNNISMYDTADTSSLQDTNNILDTSSLADINELEPSTETISQPSNAISRPTQKPLEYNPQTGWILRPIKGLGVSSFAAAIADSENTHLTSMDSVSQLSFIQTKYGTLQEFDPKIQEYTIEIIIQNPNAIINPDLNLVGLYDGKKNVWKNEILEFQVLIQVEKPLLVTQAEPTREAKIGKQTIAQNLQKPIEPKKEKPKTLEALLYGHVDRSEFTEEQLKAYAANLYTTVADPTKINYMTLDQITELTGISAREMRRNAPKTRTAIQAELRNDPDYRYKLGIQESRARFGKEKVNQMFISVLKYFINEDTTRISNLNNNFTQGYSSTNEQIKEQGLNALYEEYQNQVSFGRTPTIIVPIFSRYQKLELAADLLTTARERNDTLDYTSVVTFVNGNFHEKNLRRINPNDIRIFERRQETWEAFQTYSQNTEEASIAEFARENNLNYRTALRDVRYMQQNTSF